MTKKRYGRGGDTAIIGAGTYADDRTCAISCTGVGEFCYPHGRRLRPGVPDEVQGMTLHEACGQIVGRTRHEMDGEGGLIVVDQIGNVALPFNSDGMYRVWITSSDQAQVAIYRD